METQIKGFKWAVGLIIMLCAAWGYGIYAQADADGRDFAVLQTEVKANAKELVRSGLWLKETSNKAGKIDGLEKDIAYLVKGLDNIDKLLRLVHNVKE